MEELVLQMQKFFDFSLDSVEPKAFPHRIALNLIPHIDVFLDNDYTKEEMKMIKETNNMAMTKNKYLRSLKQKAEDAYRVSQGIPNTKVYLEKQLFDAKIGLMTPAGRAGFASQRKWRWLGDGGCGFCLV